jgi:hypothetical protein
MFASQAIAFRSSDAEELDFDPSLRPDEDQIIRIHGFRVPDAIQSALTNPLSVETLAFSTANVERIAGLFVGSLEPTPTVAFQSFNRRQMLMTNGFSIILHGDTFRRLEEPGLILDSRLAALIDGDSLFLRSYAQASRVLDLTNYYSEATNEEIAEFLESDRLHCEDVAALKDAADTWVRRKIAILRRSGAVSQLAPRKVKTAGAEFDVTIVIKRVNGKDTIVLPGDRASLKDLLRFLDEDYYKSPLSDARYVSHSKRKLASSV